MMQYNILVTGANGQLGSALRKLSMGSAHTFFFTDKNSLDITSAEAINTFFKNKPLDVCINCAAYTAVDKAEEEPSDALRLNTQAVQVLAEDCKQHGTFLIHLSTDFVYGGNQNRPFVENDKTTPLSVYAKTKLQGELLIEKHLAHYIIIRTSWLYSSYGGNFVKTILKHANNKPELNVVFDQIGTPTYANDLAAAILALINSGVENLERNAGVYHYSNEGVTSWYDFAKEIVEQASIDCDINPITTDAYPTKAKRPFYSVLNKQKIKRTFRLSIPHWQTSLKHCINELKLKDD